MSRSRSRRISIRGQYGSSTPCRKARPARSSSGRSSRQATRAADEAAARSLRAAQRNARQAAGRLSGVQHLSAGYRRQAEARADTPTRREVSGCQSAATLFLTCYRGRRTTSRSTPGSSTGHTRYVWICRPAWPGHVICISPPLPRCRVPRPREPAIISVCGHGRRELRPGRGYQPLRRDSSVSGWLLQGGTRAGLLCTAAFMMIR
jgi:hypothetical protein